MKYVYGFIKAEKAVDFGHFGIGDDKAMVRALPRDRIAAVASDTDNGPITSLPKETLAEHLAQHQLVVERVMEAGHTILPMRFGALLDSEELVDQMLETNRGKLDAMLCEIEGLFEIDVVAMWPDIQQVFAEIGRQKDIADMKNQIAKLPAAESMGQRVGFGKLVKEQLDAKKRTIQERILPSWERVAGQAVQHQIRNDVVVINASFLVDENGQAELEALVNKSDLDEGGALNFRIIGPLPPYSFSTVQLQRTSARELYVARRRLGLPACVTPQAVTDAARAAMRRFHPDSDPADSRLPEKFDRVKAAAELLKRFCQPGGLDLANTPQREFLLVEPMAVS